MIKVLVVDDSALVRKLLSDELAKNADIEVVGSAMDPYVARDKIVRLKPDVITLDLEMPRMDGLSFLAKLMKHFPMPVVVVSSLSQRNSMNALRALELGAVEVIGKPGSTGSLPDLSRQLAQAIRVASRAKTFRRMTPPPAAREHDPVYEFGPAEKIVAIGASTGGTQALEHILTQLPCNFPGTVIVQHMPEHFTATFAARLNELCKVKVSEARSGDPIEPGTAMVAPGGKHMIVTRNGADCLVRIKDGPMVHHQRPSVDVLFSSVAVAARHNAVGVLLTGMGVDGAKGMLAMREAGAHTMAQDEATSIVWGMPGEAVRLNAATKVVPLDQITSSLLGVLSPGGKERPGKRD